MCRLFLYIPILKGFFSIKGVTRMCLWGGIKNYVVTCEKCMFWCEKEYKWIGALGSCKTHYLSLVLLNLLLHHFCFFYLVSCLSVNLLWCQEYIFYCATRKRRYTLLLEGTDIHSQQQNHQKRLNSCLSLYYYGKVIVELGNNTKREFNCVYGICSLTK